MNKSIERSLCITCEHLTFCSLTTNKSFIWSCSEYEEATSEVTLPKTKKTIDNSITTKKEVQFI